MGSRKRRTWKTIPSDRPTPMTTDSSGNAPVRQRPAIIVALKGREESKKRKKEVEEITERAEKRKRRTDTEKPKSPNGAPDHHNETHKQEARHGNVTKH